MSVQDVARQAVRLLDRNSPAILTGLGVAGLVSTAYLTGKASYKSAGILRDYEEKDNGLWIKATNKEKFDLVWRLFIPAVATGLASTACIIGSQTLNHARQAALISGLSIAEGTYREYRDKNVSLFGEKNDEKVRDTIAKEGVLNNPPTSREIDAVGPGQILCKDAYSGRYFSGSKEFVRAAVNDVNEAIVSGDSYASLNDFYARIGLEPTPPGEAVGWSITHTMAVNFTSALTPEGVPCLVVEFRAFPVQDYDRYL